MPGRALAPLRLLLLLLSALAQAGPAPSGPEAGKLNVYFLDVGQGDAALIVSPTGKTVLLDGGPPEAAAGLVRRLKELTREPLDLVLLSHAHADHLGGLAPVVKARGARRYLEPGFDHPSPLYRDLLELLGRVGVPVHPLADPERPAEPLRIGLGGGAMLTVLWPRAPAEPYLQGTRSDVNSNSLVVQLSYGGTALLFTGDSEAETEQLLVGRSLPLEATLLKVAHHGSRYSSGESFLKAVRPAVAVISCGRGNEYGHPHPEALRRLAAAGAHVARTDVDGELRAVSDGTRLELSASRTGPLGAFLGRGFGPTASQGPPPSLGPPRASAAAAEAPTFAASRRSRVFHRGDCPAVQTIKPQNLLTYRQRAEALRDRTPAEDCRP